MFNLRKINYILASIFILLVIGLFIFFINKKDVSNEHYEEVVSGFKEDSFLFKDDQTGLSFNYPKEFSFYVVENRVGHSIVLEDDDGGIGFQVNVLPWDEGDGRLSRERILKDLPLLEMKRFGDVDLDIKGGVLEAVTFLTPHDSLGDLREVWFVRGNNLYQFTTPQDSKDLINIVFGTLSFE